MHPKERIEQLAKGCAFEYDLSWWGENPRTHPRPNPKNGDIVSFYRNHHVFNGVIALWARDNSHAVIFYTTPHDVADEKKYGWIPPVFRVEVSSDYVYRTYKSAKAANEESESEGG